MRLVYLTFFLRVLFCRQSLFCLLFTKLCFFFFFFSSRRRHTRYWRDWSSDVCSSDLQKCAWDRCRKRLRSLAKHRSSTCRPLVVRPCWISRWSPPFRHRATVFQSEDRKSVV